MAKRNLPKTGDAIPADQFHVSPLNVRADQPFGESDEDKVLIRQLNLGKKIVGPFKARHEDDGYGVFVGRRRFMAKKTAGFKEFVVGDDVIIEDVDDDEGRRQSLIENLDILRKEMDPMTRAHELAKLVDADPGGLRSTARQLGISPSTLSEWLKVLDLSPKMQEVLTKGLLFYSDALTVARMDFGQELQDQLAETLETQGMDAFKQEIERHAEKRLKRGIPAGKYIIERLTFDTVYTPHMELHEKLKKLAEANHMNVAEYILKVVLPDHLKRTEE